MEASYQIDVGHSSLGVLNKYYKDGYWYKQNVGGYEGKAEAICSMILSHSNITNYVKYEECLINGVPGCRSQNFLQQGESLVTFQRMYSIAYGGDLSRKIHEFALVKERIEYVISFIRDYSGFDCTHYLQTILNFDRLTLNVDRHFHNLAIIETPNGYREAPIFDCGVSLFSLQNIFKPEFTLEQKFKVMTPKPFSGNFDEQADVLGQNIELDYNEIVKELEQEDDDIKEIVIYQLKEMKHGKNSGTGVTV